MDLNLECIYCTINKADSLFSEHETDENKKIAFMKKVFGIIAGARTGDSPPYLAARIMRVLNDELQLGDIYEGVKKEYNGLLLAMEDEIDEIISGAEDPFLTALKFAMVGNFIDFAAMDEVDLDKLKDLIYRAPQQSIDPAEYGDFLRQLKDARRLTYIVDNAGEIVLDKIFIKAIKTFYPNIRIDVIVRGKPIYNDATLAEAKEAGLCALVNVTANGTDIPGTHLGTINEQAKTLIDNADLIVAKGQGNFETLFGCGKNIFYIFLCKCALFTKRFNLERYKGVFVNEKNVQNLGI